MSRHSTLGKTFACVAFAALAALRAVPADAVTYSSNFDPQDFFGTAIFDVDPSCLAFSGQVSNNGDPCSVTWESATVTIISNAGNPGMLDFAGILPSASAVQGIFVDDGELAGVDSIPIGPDFVIDPADADLVGPWWIQYVFTTDSLNGLGVVHLFHGSCILEGETRFCNPDDEPTLTAQVLDFTRVTTVPEPGTLTLLLGTLAVVAATRRYRRS